MLPLLLFGCYHYGFRPIVLTLISVFLWLGLDIAAKRVLKREAPFDLAPAVSGMLTALLLPASSPLWLPVMTAVFGTVVSVLFGENRKSIVCPAAVSVAAAFLLFPGIMTVIPQTGQMLDPFAFSLTAFKPIPLAPLETVISGFLPDTTTWEMLFGLRPGMIGETSGILILASLIYLSVRRIVKPMTAIVFLLTVGIHAYISPSLTAASDFIAFEGSVYNVLGSNTFLCAAFMLSDPKRTPKTPLGTIAAGFIGGMVTVFVRRGFDVGISALVGVTAVNLVTPVIDKFLRRAPFGGYITPEKEEKTNEETK